MPTPGHAWWHLILSNHCTWLPGDPRGFRNREHRIHSSGDYHHRPPEEEHKGLYHYNQEQSDPPQTFSPEQRQLVGKALRKTIERAKWRCLAISVGPSHSHLLLECGADVVSAKKAVRRLKRLSSQMVRDLLPGRIWASSGKPILIRDASHQQEVFRYILDHAKKEGAWTWRFDEEEKEKKRMQEKEKERISDAGSEIGTYGSNFGLGVGSSPQAEIEAPASISDPSSSTFPSPPNLHALLARFGLTAFREGQEAVISTVLAGRDSLCVMPTGGGKSLCYQLPAVAISGVTLVVSPLIALMKDQVDYLTRLGLPVTFINSTISVEEQNERLDGISRGEHRIIYVVPERFRSQRFIDTVRQVGVQLLAIDEAHCISEWGHDFRPDYARLGMFRRRMGNPTTIALTATATDAVRRDIVEQLGLDDPKIFVTGFARPNLFYEVRIPPSERQKSDYLIDFLSKTEGDGIIYVSSRKRSEEVAELVNRHTRRRAVTYHAGMEPDERKRCQEAFMSGKAQIVAATTAFGMGIDKPDVRFVVHYNMPGTIEGYYQEAGRAGRDGKPSHCLMLYHASDRHILEWFIENAYPDRDTVRKVYNMLARIDQNPIELTQQEIKEELGLSVAADGVGACEHLLEKAGVLERLVATKNMASIRIESELPTLVDLVPQRAKNRRHVIHALERLVGQRRNELVPFNPRSLAAQVEMDQTSLALVLRQLNDLPFFTYIPPFRGRAIRMIERNKSFDEIDIDFETHDKLRRAEFAKLREVIAFAMSTRCRQETILRYFGEKEPHACGNCDNCKQNHVASGAFVPLAEDQAVPEPIVEAVRMALSGVARVERQVRFDCGKTLIAQMLTGSGSSKLERLGLNKLSTFGLLKRLTQPEVSELLDALIHVDYIKQIFPEPHRPVLKLTEAGTSVMKGEEPIHVRLPITGPLLDKLTMKDREPRLARSQATVSSGKKHVAGDVANEEPRRPLTEAERYRLDRLRRWRNAEALAASLPAYCIFSNATLEAIARANPPDLDALLGVKGLGEAKLSKYGQAVLDILTK